MIVGVKLASGSVDSQANKPQHDDEKHAKLRMLGPKDVERSTKDGCDALCNVEHVPSFGNPLVQDDSQVPAAPSICSDFP